MKNKTPSRGWVSRRAFLGGAGALAPAFAGEGQLGPLPGQQRRAQALQVRMDAANFQRDLPLPEQLANGDELLYTSRIGNFSKGLPHNSLGEVDPNAYYAFLAALSSGRPADFENLPMGCPDPARRFKLVNPQAGLSYEMEGADAQHLAQPPAPRFSSAEAAGEMVELYWQALARDVPFTEYPTTAIAQAAAADLSRLSDFRGPRIESRVAPSTLFRGFTAGDVVGPYISQFLLRPIPFGAQWIDQRIRTAVPGVDHATTYQD